jgi:hypothetical protein
MHLWVGLLRGFTFLKVKYWNTTTLNSTNQTHAWQYKNKIGWHVIQGKYIYF